MAVQERFELAEEGSGLFQVGSMGAVVEKNCGRVGESFLKLLQEQLCAQVVPPSR